MKYWHLGTDNDTILCEVLMWVLIMIEYQMRYCHVGTDNDTILGEVLMWVLIMIRVLGEVLACGY